MLSVFTASGEYGFHACLCPSRTFLDYFRSKSLNL